MKVIILAGGLGTRLGEETLTIPKPMVEIGGYPILWHIMQIYSHFGFNEFAILCGYKIEVIKDYFLKYYTTYSDVTVDLFDDSIEIHKNHISPWKVTILNTGNDTMTGARIKMARSFVNNETFMLTYGDGISNLNLNHLVDHHEKSGKLATVTAIKPEGRFGAIRIENNNEVSRFQEKKDSDYMWVSGGFFVLEPKIFDYIPDGKNVIWEQESMEKLVADNQLTAFKHYGFWKSVDTPKDKNDLNEMWKRNEAPWKIWE